MGPGLFSPEDLVAAPAVSLWDALQWGRVKRDVYVWMPGTKTAQIQLQ